MNAAFFAFSERGKKTALELSKAPVFSKTALYTSERLAGGEFSALPSPAAPFFHDAWERFEALVFVCACGIAVRYIAPHVKDKTRDPAVVCTDEQGKFAIPLLSGHIGGANALAVSLAEYSGGTPAVTTATDVNGRFSVDTFARERGYIIDDMKAAKRVSAAILEKDIPFYTDLAVKTPYPPSVYPADKGDIGVCLSARKTTPFKDTLRLIPKTLVAGVGCRRDTPRESIESAVNAVFEKAGLDVRALRAVCSIDLKKDEAGLLSFCESVGVSPVFYTADELLKAKGDFTPSAFVKSVTGVDNVCERAAALCAGREPFIKKTACGGVTVAVAEIESEVSF